MAEYIQQTAIIKEIGFALINSSAKAAHDITIEITVPKKSDLVIQSNSDYPPFPRSGITGLQIDVSRFLSARENSIDVRRLRDKYIITADFKKARPAETVFSEFHFIIGSNIPQTLELEAVIRAENLPEPIKVPLRIQIKTSSEKLSVQDILDWKFKD